MFFTQEDYKKIQQWLQRNSIRDTEFQEALPIKGNEWLTIIQDGYNRKINLDNLSKQILDNTIDFINISNRYNAIGVTLEKALQYIPYKMRKEGQYITFINDNNEWVTYQFVGALNQWNILDMWKLK